MHRRHLLAALGTGLAGVAGCLSTQGPSTNGTATDDQGMVVEDIVVQKSAIYGSTMGSGGVLAEDERQYVVGAVQGVDQFHDTEFTFETDSDSWGENLPDTAGGVNRSVAGRQRPYVAFRIPSPLSPSDPRIVSDDGTEWPVPESEHETFDAPQPQFELDELSVPDSVSQGHDLSVSLTATNTSETDGRFLAALYWPTNLIADDDESHIIDPAVGAGEQVTASVLIDTAYTTTEDGPITLDVQGHVEASREVQVTDVSTPD